MDGVAISAGWSGGLRGRQGRRRGGPVRGRRPIRRRQSDCLWRRSAALRQCSRPTVEDVQIWQVLRRDGPETRPRRRAARQDSDKRVRTRVGWFVPAPHRSGSSLAARIANVARLVGDESRKTGGGVIPTSAAARLSLIHGCPSRLPSRESASSPTLRTSSSRRSSGSQYPWCCSSWSPSDV